MDKELEMGMPIISCKIKKCYELGLNKCDVQILNKIPFNSDINEEDIINIPVAYLDLIKNRNEL